MTPVLPAQRTILVTGPPRSGVALVAARLAGSPATRLLDAAPLGREWLELALAGGEPGPEWAARLEKSWAEVHGPDGGAAFDHLVLTCPQLLTEADLAQRLAASPLAACSTLVLVERSAADAVCSLARFPHLHPDLPDPWSQRSAFLAAAVEKWRHSVRSAEALEQLGLPVVRLPYEHLVRSPGAALERLRQALGMPHPPAGLPPRELHGISGSLCFRERPLDQVSLDRWQRQLRAEETAWLEERCGAVTTAAAFLPPEPGRAPILATGRGGSGTRLLSELLTGLGVDLGSRLNATGDSIQWADLLYEMSNATLAGHATPWSGSWAAELHHRARWLRAGASPSQSWGFKLPEAMLVLEHLLDAWPEARLIHLVRHPLDTCLRRTHMTSRPSNPIGAATLAEAYRLLGWSRDPAGDEPHCRNAASWWYQLTLLQRTRERHPERVIELRYEDLCDQPRQAAAQLAHDLGLPQRGVELNVEGARRRRWQAGDPRIEEVWDLCAPLAQHYGYGKAG
jgi:LPS sulfotransferase NodH